MITAPLKIERWSLLALLRFILALVVTFSHLEEYTNPGALKYLSYGFFEAVLGFLFISGYSIGESYGLKPEGFYRRRLKRIYPVYIAALVIAWFAHPLEWSVPVVLMLLANLFFLNQIVTSQSFVGPAWSLSLEVWYYACAPLFRRMTERALWILVGFSLVCFVIQIVGNWIFHWQLTAMLGYGLNFPIFLFAWVLGCMLSWLPDKRRVLKVTGWVFAGHVALQFALNLAIRLKKHQLPQFSGDLLRIGSYAAVLLLVWWIFHLLITRDPAGARKSNWMRFLGDVSYPLYLVHKPLYIFLQRKEVTNPYVMVATALGVATLVFLLVDRYAQKREKRIEGAAARLPAA